jgi:hypothetical protein
MLGMENQVKLQLHVMLRDLEGNQVFIGISRLLKTWNQRTQEEGAEIWEIFHRSHSEIILTNDIRTIYKTLNPKSPKDISLSNLTTKSQRTNENFMKVKTPQKHPWMHFSHAKK